jgi:SUMO ligase MMS21 Smc5/6 complex component
MNTVELRFERPIKALKIHTTDIENRPPVELQPSGTTILKEKEAHFCKMDTALT